MATNPYGAAFDPMPAGIAEVRSEIKRVLSALQNFGVPDEQEQAQRVDAAQAYAGESPMHYVNYAEECVRTTASSLRDVRAVQRQCWDVYQEVEPPNYSAKEEWQSRAVLPKPYAAVQFAVAMVQAAFSPQFLSIKNEPSNHVDTFWTKLMERQLDEQHSNFVVRFTDASEMGFAVGQSLEMIPIWDSTRGCLTYSLVEPWKIDRDPNALNREPQSGMYWVHSEWQDYYLLREAEKQGRYRNTQGLNNVGPSEGIGQNRLLFQTEQARMRNYVHQRNRYRTAVLTREFWGTVLAPNGEMLLPSASYTTAGGQRLISEIQPSPYSTLRWPGVGFSPLPHLLRFEGRSLLQSVCSLWYLMCNLLSLHADYQNWIVNPMREINQHALVDQEDTDVYPGKVYLTRDTVSGQMTVRTVDQRFITGDILANEGWLDQVFQRGSMVTDTVQGLPGYRQEITARESAQHLAQSRTTFTKMGMNADLGAVQAILAGMETIRLDATPQTILEVFTLDELNAMFPGQNGQPSIFDPTSPTGLKLPPLLGNVHVSGLQTLLQESEELQAIERLIVPMSTHPVFGPYIQPYNVVKAIEARANLEDEKLTIGEDEAKKLMQTQGERAQKQADVQMQLMELQVAAIQKKAELDERSVALKEQLGAAEAKQAQLDMMVQALEVEQAQIATTQEHVAARADLAKIAADIAAVMHRIKTEETQLVLEVMTVEGQLAKIAGALEAQQVKLEHDARRLQIEQQQVDVARMQAQRQPAGAQA